MARMFLILLGFAVAFVAFIYLLNKDASSKIATMVKPFDARAAFKDGRVKRKTATYTLRPLLECYIKYEPNKESDEYREIAKLYNKRLIFWDLISIPFNGYYENDECFAAYVNKNIGVSLNNIEDSAKLGEMLIRRYYEGILKEKIDKYPSDFIVVGDTGQDSRGVYDEGANELKGEIVISNDPVHGNTTDEVLFVVMHEEMHAFASKLNGRLALVRPQIPRLIDEDITEFLRVQVTNGSGWTGEEDREFVIDGLLQYVSADEIANVYFNGAPRQFRNIVDTKTYDGALCTYTYYVDAIVAEEKGILKSTFKTPEEMDELKQDFPFILTSSTYRIEDYQNECAFLYY